MRYEFDIDEGESAKPQRGPMRRPGPIEQSCGQFHSEHEGHTDNEPHRYPTSYLYGTCEGEARAQPIEEPYLHPVST